MNVFDTIQQFLLTELVNDASKKAISPDEDLLMEGVIDSLGILKLVAFVNKTFGVKIDDEEIIPENFQTLNALTEFIKRKSRN